VPRIDVQLDPVPMEDVDEHFGQLNSMKNW
jgi:hypothetical protein